MAATTERSPPAPARGSWQFHRLQGSENISDIYPLSPLRRGILFESLVGGLLRPCARVRAAEEMWGLHGRARRHSELRLAP